tara:strand:+ start:414 stop:617 length:204 start_codon:yes stop_codon:yes gene_type:complete
VDEDKVVQTFFDIINQEDWSEDVYVGEEDNSSTVMKQFITLPTPHPHFFINLVFEYEYNPDLGDKLW